MRGRPPVPVREVLAGIVFRLRTGCQWKALPREFGSGSTCHRRFKEWCAAGVFTKVFSKLLKFYDRRRGVEVVVARQRHGEGAERGDLTGPLDRPRKVASNATF